MKHHLRKCQNLSSKWLAPIRGNVRSSSDSEEREDKGVQREDKETQTPLNRRHRNGHHNEKKIRTKKIQKS
jgi:hypothetical protein